MGVIAERGSLPVAPAPKARADRRARARMWDRVATGALWTLAAALTSVLAYLILYMLVQGLHVISLDFLTKANIAGDFDGPEVFNTFYIIILALAICVPLALGGAIYLVEYARQGFFTTVLRFATETLAGVPSIVLGMFGFLLFVSHFGNGLFLGFSRLAGALTLVILNLPLLLRVSEDAMRSVPNELREGSAALGANKAQTVARVLVPSSLAGLTTGIILTAGKMIGETAALIFTSGQSSSVNGWFSLNPLLPGDTLTVRLYTVKSEGITHNALAVQAGTATLLVILLLVFNLGLRGIAGLVIRRVSGR